MAAALHDDHGQVVYTGGVYLCLQHRVWVRRLIDRGRYWWTFRAVHRPTVVDDDLVDVVRDRLPPHLIPPEVSHRITKQNT